MDSNDKLIEKKDECLRGTWKQEKGIVFVCPNPGYGEWGRAAAPEEIAAPQKWQRLEGKKEFLKAGQSRSFKKQKIVVFCENEKHPYPKGYWEKGYDMKRSKYRIVEDAGVMMLCQ